MRMFLVGMCDIFLILYLTTLSRVDPRLLSELTVEDYYEVKKSEEEIRELLEQRKAELKSIEDKLDQSERKLGKRIAQISKLAKEKQDSDSELKQTKDDLESLYASFLSLKEEEAQRRLSAEQAEKAREEALALLEKRKQELEQAQALRKRSEEEKERANSRSEDLESTVEQITLKTKDLESLLEEFSKKDKKTSEEIQELKKHEKEARIQAENAKREAEQAREESTEAAAREAQALAQAALAEKNEQTARSRALRSAREASFSRTKTHEAYQRAAKAEQKARTTKKKIEAITQPAAKAYSSSVRKKLVSVQTHRKTENVLIGTSTSELKIVGLPVNISGKRVVFARSESVGLDSEVKSDRVKQYQIIAEGRPVRELLLNPRIPSVVGLVLASAVGPAVSLRPKVRSKDALMPMLIAVRAHTPGQFRDRIRDVDREYFVFKRDRLQSDRQGRLHYRAQGIRGTKDFSGTIIEGDQIVNLEGQFLGIAVERNYILPISSTLQWQVMPLTGKDGRQIFESWKTLLNKKR